MLMPAEAIIILCFIFIIGTIIGSFLNVVIFRAFSGESIVLPPSKCPDCGNKLKWYHNIPILSYIFLGGKCGFCKEPISIQYPIIEFLTGVIFLLVFLKFGFAPETIFGFIIASLLIVISTTDIKEKVVFDSHTYALIASGILYSIYRTAAQIIHVNQSSTTFVFTWDWFWHSPFIMGLAGALAGAVVMEAAARSGYLFAGKRAFGEGDSYIAAGLGAVFGLKNLPALLILSVIIQLIFTVPVFLKKVILAKDWKILISLTLFVIFCGLFYYMQHSIYTYSGFIVLTTGLIFVLSGIMACIYILKGLRSEQIVTYLPFGPALALSGLILLLLF